MARAGSKWLEDPSASKCGEGSGVIYKIDGDTAPVTNNHVVENIWFP